MVYSMETYLPKSLGGNRSEYNVNHTRNISRFHTFDKFKEKLLTLYLPLHLQQPVSQKGAMHLCSCKCILAVQLHFSKDTKLNGILTLKLFTPEAANM